MNISAYLINMAWSIFNLLGTFICIKVAYQKPIFRGSERIIINDAKPSGLKMSYAINSERDKFFEDKIIIDDKL